MTSGRAMFALLLASVCTTSMVFAEAPVASSAGAGSAAGSGYPSQYGFESGGYDSAMPAPSYGAPAPAPVYGPPPAQGYRAPSQPFRGYGLDSENPFVQQRLFNTAVALTVPLFSFQLPQRSATTPGGLDLANQAIFGVFALFVVALVFAVPVLFTRPDHATGRSNDRDGIMNHLMANNKVFNFMGADLSNKIGLDTTKCLQKSICDAHRAPKKYGMLATPFQMFFPPATNGTEARASIFQIAAKDGKYTKKDCGKKYSCFFDTMDLAQYMVDWWKHSSDPNYVLEL